MAKNNKEPFNYGFGGNEAEVNNPTTVGINSYDDAGGNTYENYGDKSVYQKTDTANNYTHSQYSFKGTSGKNDL